MKISLVFLASAMWAMIFFGLALAISFRWPELVDPRKSPVFAMGAGSALLLLFLLWFYYFKTIRCYMIVERIVLFFGRKFFILRANLSILHSKIRGSEEFNTFALLPFCLLLAPSVSVFIKPTWWLAIPAVGLICMVWSIKNLIEIRAIKKQKWKYKHDSCVYPTKKYPTR